MEDHEKEGRPEQQWEDRAPAATTRWLVILSVLLFAAVIFAVGYGYEQSTAVAELNQQNLTMHSAEVQMRSQIDSLTAKIDQMTAPPPAASADGTLASNGAAGAVKSTAKHAASATELDRWPGTRYHEHAITPSHVRSANGRYHR